MKKNQMKSGLLWSTMALLTAGAAAPAFAQTGPNVDTAPPQDTVTITATKLEAKADEVPATVTVKTAEQIENELATDIKDLVRFEPGVSVRSSPTRFGAAQGTTGRDGNSGFNIRGIEGNRVLIQVDGVRIPDSYEFGAQIVGRGDFVDLDLLKSVEIVRGPSSALYGSDGLAGTVTFVTRDPADLIKTGATFGARARTSYAEADQSWAHSLMGAATFGQVSGMLAYTRRDGKEQSNMGENREHNARRTAPNPADLDSDSYLAKFVWTPNDTNRVRFTYDASRHKMVADVLTNRAATPPALASTSVISLDAIDSTRRERFSIDHAIEFGSGFLKRGEWAVYQQTSTTSQFTLEDRNTAVDRIRDNTFDNKVTGFSGQLEAGFDTGPAKHRLLVGADWSKTEQESIRDGAVPPAGETFPVRAFPLTDYTIYGLFVQDEISLLDGTLKIYPALRYDSYELETTRDALYPVSFPAANGDDSHVSPKLSAIAWPVDWLGAYATYATGYKAPAPSQINNGFVNPVQGYRSISNPDLKPETSESLEAGIRVRNIPLFGAKWAGSVAAFSADYEDFIERTQVSGVFGNPSNPAVFQFTNISSVEISGVEARVDGAWDNGLGFTLAASHAEGTMTSPASTPATGALQTIEPDKLVAGITFADQSGRFGGMLAATWSDNKTTQNSGLASTAFLPPSFTVYDLTAYWNITDAFAVRAGVFNLTDEKYWWWGDVRGLAASSTTRDAYTQPGRNVSASLSYRY